MVKRGTGPKSLMEKIERMPRAWSLLGYVRDVLCPCRTGLCVSCPSKVGPSVGSRALPFIDQGGSRGYRWEKEENTKGTEGPSKDLGLPFFPVSALHNIADRVRRGVFVDLRRPCPSLF